ncbi:MAG: CBS domain-containing protein [Chloroflexi bacterium]|nr:CBS domain-containing protein [Chloroflexota bacterium]
MKVREAMTPNPITVTADTPLPKIVDLMREHRVRRVPVVDGDRLIGIISDHDVMATMPSPATTLSRWEMNTLLEKVRAKEIMTSPVYVAAPECPIEEVARMMLQRKFGAMPVLDDDDKLVGIVTESDIFRMFVDMLSGEEPGLRFELRVERHRGVLSNLAAIVNDNGGGIIAIATLNEPDHKYKRVLVKEEGGDPERVRAALEKADIEVLDVSERGVCGIRLIKA